jgi:SpoVK/Ycf46/Vps4 family AAA+-type ATPase
MPKIDIKKIQGYEDIGKVETINDILNIAKKFQNIINDMKKRKKNTHVKYLKKYGMYSLGTKKYIIDPERTIKLIKPLKKLNKMIGLKSAKEQVCEIIVHKLQSPPNLSMSNTLITGPPGVGKTTFSKIFATIQSALKIVKSDRIVMTSRADWIGDHFGGTEIKTAELIKKGKGGVIIIDEGYSLGSSNGKDSFAQACITEIIKSMTEKPGDVCFHFLGYEEQMRENLLKENPGLDRRLPIRINIPGYDIHDMTDIMIYFLAKNKIQFEPSVKKSNLENLIKENIKSFPGYAGDIENVVEKCIMINNKINSNYDPSRKHKNIFSLEIIKKGIDRYNENKEDKTNMIDIQSLYT